MQFISYIGIIVHENIKSKREQNFRSNLIYHILRITFCLNSFSKAIALIQLMDNVKTFKLQKYYVKELQKYSHFLTLISHKRALQLAAKFINFIFYQLKAIIATIEREPESGSLFNSWPAKGFSRRSLKCLN